MQSFSEFIIKNGIIGFFEKPLTLKSGRQSHFYVNWRRATNDAYLLDQLSDFLLRYIQDNKLICDTLYGVPEGASKTAVITGMKLAKSSPLFSLGSHVVAMGRAQPKDHGDPADRFFIGKPEGHTYVLEDTITTGLSLFKCLDQLLEANVDVRGVICLTDRCERTDDGASVRELIKRRFGNRIAYHAMSEAPGLLKILVQQQKPSESIIRALSQELGLSFDQDLTRPSEVSP